MNPVFRIRKLVSLDHVDGNGHVNNVRYVQWMQDAAAMHADSLGWPSDRLRRMGAAWVVRSHWIEYLRPAVPETEMEIQTWVAEFGKVRSLRKYRFIAAPEGLVLAQAETDWVMVNVENGKPRLIPADLIADFPVAPDH